VGGKILGEILLTGGFLQEGSIFSLFFPKLEVLRLNNPGGSILWLLKGEQ